MLFINQEKELMLFYIPSLSKNLIHKLLKKNNFVQYINNSTIYNEKHIKSIITHGIRYFIRKNFDNFKIYNLFEYKRIIIIENPYLRFINNYLYLQKKYNKIEINKLLLHEFFHIIPSQSHYYNIKQPYYMNILIIYKGSVMKKTFFAEKIIFANSINDIFKELELPEFDNYKEIKDYETDLYKNYTQELLELVNKIYSEDFENFGYEKFEKIEDFKNHYIQQDKSGSFSTNN
jgi:hypothetical protein